MAYLKNWDKRSTLAYRFTVATKKDLDLLELKRLVRANNRKAKEWGHYTTQRVRLMARGGQRGRSYSTPHANATHFDVYVH